MAGTSGKNKRRKDGKAAAADKERTRADSGTEAADSTAPSQQTEPEATGFLQKLSTKMGNSNLDEMTAWEIVTMHPLIRVGKYVFIPYLLYLGWFYIQLQHPEYISKFSGGLINLRPAIHGTDIPRQVLIVSTPGSGTVQMATELRNKLSLEIGHESTDAAWSFTRDGSISWFHGIRFLTPPSEDKEKLQFISKICNSDAETHSNMGFHPAMYGPPTNKCSYRSKWNNCWQTECYVQLFKEWGCGVNKSKSCDIKFAKNIHQVRNPMKTLESLVVKYCIGGLGGVVAAPFLTYASAMFPIHDFYADSCIEAVGSFMVMYQESMIEAMRRGDIDAFFRIEESSACDVAEAAGLLASNTTVYEPNHIRINRLCNESDEESSAQKTVEQKLNKVNKDQVKLGWKDLRGGMHGSRREEGDRTLERQIKNLFRAFKYYESTVPLQVDYESEFGEL